jgi:hypothetical protein
MSLPLLSAQTTTVVLAPTKDATLYQDPAGLLANGAGQYLFAGTNGNGLVRRALLQFDIAGALPPKARVVDVQLRLVASRSSAAAPAMATLHRVTTGWSEGSSVAGSGEGGGGSAVAGDATWTHAVLPTVLWNQVGGDFASEVSSATLMPPVGPFAFGKTVRLIADVQDWLDGRLPNHGWLLRTDELASNTSRRIDSRQNNDPNGVRPELVVSFLAPGTAQDFGVGCSTSGGMPFLQTVVGQPVGGQAATLRFQSGVPRGLFITALSYDVLPEPLQIDVGCFWWLRQIPHPNLGIRFHDNTGVTLIPLTFPVSTELFGTPIALQSILVDLLEPRQYALSNATLVCFG